MKRFIYMLLSVCSALLTSGCNNPDTVNSIDTITDIDGNVYHMVAIGTQTWMVENLKTTRYNDGNAIPLVTDSTAWSDLTTPGYCWYMNNEAVNKNTYGALYNWHAVNTGKLSPTGWHVATEAEWDTLISYLGGDTVAGGKLKETGLAHWVTPNNGATNDFGFSALPGGKRDPNGTFTDMGNYGAWWTATEYDFTISRYFYMEYDKSDAFNSGTHKKSGFSVRCVRNGF